MVTSHQLRQEFLAFFQARRHQVVPSSPLIPQGDPTLLLTSAGMVQFKPYFLGEMAPPSRRLASCQKCFRTTDIDSVGNLKHLTFFEMLGNFSVGDYFKAEAIAWAWEFVTKNLSLPRDRLWATVYREDDEAFGLWRDKAPAGRILRLGEKDNFWGPAGATGPCGPCSEIHYDMGADVGCRRPECAPGCDCGRFLEIWNLVFMQYFQDEAGKRTPLVQKNIDTGMGLERTLAILQGKPSFYETDLFAPLMERIQELCHTSYGADEAKDRAMRIVAEHGRAVAFLLADGVIPSNERRGYVLRRVLRRAALFGRKLGLEGPFLGEVARTVIGHMGHVYPGLPENKEFVLRVIGSEEAKFNQTLEKGLEILGGYSDYLASIPRDKIDKIAQALGKVPLDHDLALGVMDLQSWVVKKSLTKEVMGGPNDRIIGFSEAWETFNRAIHELDGVAGPRAFPVTPGQKSPAYPQYVNPDEARQKFEVVRRLSREIPGDEVYRLYDTYGFPAELTAEIAREHSLSVDMEGFQAEMAKQRERARAAHSFSGRIGGGKASLEVYETLGLRETPFLGYDALEHRTMVVGLLRKGEWLDRATEGQEAEAVLAETPFYAEKGGQVGDSGVIIGPTGYMEVQDTLNPLAGLAVHRGRVAAGELAVGQEVTARVEEGRRLDIARNHTATHLLQAALREVLGGHVRQMGSLVAPDRLRFDLSHPLALSPEELSRVEDGVNDNIRRDLPVAAVHLPYKEALAQGAIALFDEKYGEMVRMMEISGPQGRVSAELCGGTHLERTGQVGLFLILSEASIGGGLRRIEAVTGRGALALVRERLGFLEEMARAFQTPLPALRAKITSLKGELEEERKRASTLEREMALQEARALLKEAKPVDGIPVLSVWASASNMDILRQMGDFLRDKLGSGVVVLGAVFQGKPSFLAMVTPDLVARGLHAGELAKRVAQASEGSGGGRPLLGQGGGPDLKKLEVTLRQVPLLVRERLKSNRPYGGA